MGKENRQWVFEQRSEFNGRVAIKVQVVKCVGGVNGQRDEAEGLELYCLPT